MAKRDVELVIRARDQATKSVDAISESLDRLEKEQLDTAKSSKKVSSELENLTRDLAKVGTAGAAGQAFSKITAAIESSNVALAKQESQLAETVGQQQAYVRQLEAAKVKLESLKKATSDFTGPLRPDDIKEQVNTVKLVERAIKELEGDLKSTTASAQRQSEALAKSKVELRQMDGAAEELKTTLAQVEQLERRVAEATSKATAEQQKAAAAAEKQARAAALLAQRSELRSGTITRIDTGVAMGKDPAASVRKARADWLNAAAALQKLKKEFESSTSPTVALGSALGKQQIAVSQLRQNYEDLRSAATKRIELGVQAAAAAEKQAAAERKLAEASAKAAESTSKASAAAQGRAQRLAVAEIEFAGRGQVQAQQTGVENLQKSVMSLKSVYSQLDAELKKVQTTSGVFGQRQDELRAQMIRVQGAIRSGENSIRGLERASSGAASAVSRTGKAAAAAGREHANGAAGVSRFWAEIRKANEGARTTLTLYQRLRGQVLSLVAAYGGLYAGGALVSGIAEATREMEAIEARFKIGFGGDDGRAAEELEYTRKLAGELGLEFKLLAKDYSKLTAASLGTNLEGDKTRDIFTAMAQAARVMRLSGDELSGTFKAVTDIMSKGTVQAEELKGQLGDRFPGAVQIMASGLGIGTEQLMKMMEQGQLTSETLLYFAAEMRNRVAPGIEEATKSFAADLDRFKNAWFELQVAVGRSGFLDGLGEGLKRATELMRDPQVIDGAKRLGQALGNLIVSFVEMTRNADLVITSFKVLFGFIAGNFAIGAVSSLATAVMSLINSLRTLAAVVAPVLAALAPFLGWITAVAAALATPFIANWAYENFPAFAEAVLSLQSTALGAWDAIGFGLQRLGINMKAWFTKIIGELRKLWFGFTADVYGIASSVAGFVGAKKLADSLAQTTKDATEKAKAEYNKYQYELALIDADQAATKLERDKDLVDQIAAYRKRKLIESGEPFDKSKSPTAIFDFSAAGAGGPTSQFNQPPPYVPPAAKGAGDKELDNLAKSVAERIERFRQQIRENMAKDDNLAPADQLNAELEAIRTNYSSTFDDLRKLGKDRNSEEWKTVEALIAQEQMLARQKFSEAELQRLAKARADEVGKAKDAERDVNDLLQLRRDLMQQIQMLEEQGGASAEARANELRARLAEVDAEMAKALDKAIQLAQTLGGPEGEQLVLKLERMKLKMGEFGEETLISKRAIDDLLVSGGTDAFMAIGESIGGLIDGTMSFKEAIGSLGDIFRQFAADFLRRIAEMIIQQAILNALQSSGFGGAVSGAVSSIFHEGGIAGSAAPTRTVNPAIFRNAARYHSGGIAGIKPGEVPAILQKGEEVLTRDDPRHIANAAGSQQPMSVKIVNTIDSGSMVSEGLSTAEGERSLFNFVRANKAAFKQILA